MNALLIQLQTSLTSFWMERNARERKQIELALSVAVCGLLYMLLIGPALNGRAQLVKSLPELRLQAAELQGLSTQAAALSAITAAPVPAMSKESIEAALTSKGLKPQSVAMSGTDTAKVQLSAVSFAGLLDWLNDMQKNARISVVDANIVAQTQTDIVNATLTLKQ